MTTHRPRTENRPTWSCWLVAILLIAGCGYGKVSPATYEYAKALYSITNRQAADRLPDVEQRIANDVGAGKIADDEAGWLMDIIKDAENGRWEAANKAARKMMDDQVNR